MKRWWLADAHLTHDNILEYCDRPYPDAIRMLHRIAVNCNQKIRAEDTVIHVGDWMSKGNVKGKPSLPFKFDEVRRLFNGHWTFLNGNHDECNDVRVAGDCMLTRVGKYNAFVGHVPLAHHMFPYPAELEAFVHKHCHVVICGHVHKLWRTTFIDGMLHVNVGLDVQNYFPIDDHELIELISMKLKGAAHEHRRTYSARY